MTPSSSRRVSLLALYRSNTGKTTTSPKPENDNPYGYCRAGVREVRTFTEVE